MLSNDPTVLFYLGIGSNSDNLTKAKHIQKRSKPQNLIENLPLITFYAPPGSRERYNSAVYQAPIVFDIYTSDDVNTAHLLTQRIQDLFEGEIPPMEGIESFEAFFVTGHESSTDLTNTYCFTIVIDFSITIDKYS